jgi:hypothetical protein
MGGRVNLLKVTDAERSGAEVRTYTLLAQHARFRRCRNFDDATQAQTREAAQGRAAYPDAERPATLVSNRHDGRRGWLGEAVRHFPTTEEAYITACRAQVAQKLSPWRFITSQ